MYVTSALLVENFNRSNDDSWADDIILWVGGQEFEEHLTKKIDKTDENEKIMWKKIDA